MDFWWWIGETHDILQTLAVRGCAICLARRDPEDMAIPPPLSKTQVDRLGDRLKRGSYAEDDLRALDSYRRTFGAPYSEVVEALLRLKLEPTGRPAKSTESLVEKLRRESIRLVQVQDIAGCRVVVADMTEQDQLVTRLCSIFPGASVVDRRLNPSYGYRAVHVIPEIAGKLIEIQVRTSMQHLWAETSERLSDQIDKDLKYGGGPEDFRYLLAESSGVVAQYEEVYQRYARAMHDRQSQQQIEGHLAERDRDLADVKATMEAVLDVLHRLFSELTSLINDWKSE